MARTVEHDRRDVVHAPPERLGDRLDVLCDGTQEVGRAAGTRADRDLPHVHVGQPHQIPGVADRDHRHRAVAAPRHDAATLERVEREVDLGPPAPSVVPGVSPVVSSNEPKTTRPLIDSVSSVARIPVAAASSAATWSSRPSQRAAPSAARSVARRIRLALARHRMRRERLVRRRIHLDVRHTRSLARSAAESTSSATDDDARFALSFSITATPSRTARATR